MLSGSSVILVLAGRGRHLVAYVDGSIADAGEVAGRGTRRCSDPCPCRSTSSKGGDASWSWSRSGEWCARGSQRRAPRTARRCPARSRKICFTRDPRRSCRCAAEVLRPRSGSAGGTGATLERRRRGTSSQPLPVVFKAKSAAGTASLASGPTGQRSTPPAVGRRRRDPDETGAFEERARVPGRVAVDEPLAHLQC